MVNIWLQYLSHVAPFKVEIASGQGYLQVGWGVRSLKCSKHTCVAHRVGGLDICKLKVHLEGTSSFISPQFDPNLVIRNNPIMPRERSKPIEERCDHNTVDQNLGNRTSCCHPASQRPSVADWGHTQEVQHGSPPHRSSSGRSWGLSRPPGCRLPGPLQQPAAASHLTPTSPTASATCE